MLLKRQYEHGAPPERWTTRRYPCETCRQKGVVVNDAGDDVVSCPTCDGAKVRTARVPPILHLTIRHTGVHPAQNFSVGLVTAGQAEGWLAIEGDQLSLKTEPERLFYTILRWPGRYCCHCGDKLDDDATGELARAHVALLHDGAPSPDPQHPAGYRVVTAYECVLDAGQHARWQRPAGSTVAHWREDG